MCCKTKVGVSCIICRQLCTQAEKVIATLVDLRTCGVHVYLK